MVQAKVSQVKWRQGGIFAGMTAAVLLAVCLAVPAGAVMEGAGSSPGITYNPNGAFTLNGKFVMNVGEVQINVTNFGLIGSMYSSARRFSGAPSCQWPAGSGDEYLWAAGLWVGGVVLGERLVTAGGADYISEIYPKDEVESTIYEAQAGALLRPAGNTDASGNREPGPNPDDDDDGLIDEEILNGHDDDGDGLIDEDFGQIGNQMMVATMYDNTSLAREDHPDHTPLNLQIVRQTYQWENDQVDDFVGFEYTIKNIGVTEIENVYIGFYADADIAARGTSGGAGDDMAGSWPTNHGNPGMVLASDGSYVPIQVGYMYDGAESAPLPGYYGILFLGHDIDPTGFKAPTRVGMRTFQRFSGQQNFAQGGDPTNDDEAYQLLSAPLDEWDGDTQDGKQNDFRFLVSAGPFSVLSPSDQLSFQVGMVMGAGLDGLLANCAEAALTWYGIYLDKLGPQETPGGEVNPGSLGRETILCREDFPPGKFDQLSPDFGDTSCMDPNWATSQPRITDAEVFRIDVNGTTKNCSMFNLDNCFECARHLGHWCESADFEESKWKCNDPDASEEDKKGCTGIDGNESQIHWLVGMAPPPPGLRLWPADGRVHVFWDDVSMITKDIRLQKIDFESYRIWRADNWDRPFGSSIVNGPENSLWQMIAEYDVVDSFITYRDVGNQTYVDTIPLGTNTGLDAISYRPRVLDDPQFEGLAEAMQVVVDNDPENELVTRPDLRDPEGRQLPEYSGLAPWETFPDVLDTFFAVTYRAPNVGEGIKEKHSTEYFEYIDRDIHNGFIYFYSVTASDHAMSPAGTIIDGHVNRFPTGAGLAGDPTSSFTNAVPGTKSQTPDERAKFGANIYVYPNPATRDALADYQQLYPNGDDPTGVRVTFTNLPEAHNTISIFTVSGDLVQTIDHDGTTGSGHLSWNLMSRNGQEIVSGVYLYSVQSDDDRFDDFVGKFVVVR
ncbi:hypothetical protein CO151_06030 [bacterium CG_4_9_14_3_um_filter_65_15]|nr:MAG: hypothetical protein CO151_06030 [bacterium CG_4_9_14_3_um_filter_65_15]